MQIKKEILGFGSSGYYNAVIVSVLSILAGITYALFPYQNLSLAYMTSPAVMFLAMEASLCVFVLITWVMYISYRLDRDNDWSEKMAKRLLLQGLYGWIIPFGVILLYVGMVYGQPVFDQEYMQFVIAVYMLFLFVLNRHGYIIFLSQKKTGIKREMLLLQEDRERILAELGQQQSQMQVIVQANEEKQTILREQIDFLKKENTVQKQKIEGLEERNGQLLDTLSEQEILLAGYRSKLPEKTYEIKYSPSHILAFKESEIAGFVITDKKNEKPLINLFTKDGRNVLTNEASLKHVEREFAEMVRINRWYLVARDQILDFTENKEVGVHISLAFAQEDVEVKKEKWKIIGADIRTWVQSQKHRHQNPSPDA